MTNEIAEVLSKTWDHLFTITLAALTPRDAAVLLQMPLPAAAAARVDRMALTGDVLATQRACQQWNNACKAAVRQQQESACST
jgi:hypothetical protein